MTRPASKTQPALLDRGEAVTRLLAVEHIAKNMDLYISPREMGLDILAAIRGADLPGLRSP